MSMHYIAALRTCITWIYTYVGLTPNVFLKPNYLHKGVIGEAHKLICLIALSDTSEGSLVNLTWSFTSNDDRVTVIPTTVTTDDSIGIIYTTVIQFAYLMERDDRDYPCILTVGGKSVKSVFILEIIGKCG